MNGASSQPLTSETRRFSEGVMWRQIRQRSPADGMDWPDKSSRSLVHADWRPKTIAGCGSFFKVAEVSKR
jgi:hypothetical protein